MLDHFDLHPDSKYLTLDLTFILIVPDLKLNYWHITKPPGYWRTWVYDYRCRSHLFNRVHIGKFKTIYLFSRTQIISTVSSRVFVYEILSFDPQKIKTTKEMYINHWDRLFVSTTWINVWFDGNERNLQTFHPSVE